MTVDPRTNVVVFQLNTSADEIVVGHAPTLAEDGVSQAWEGVRHKHGAHAGSVVAVHAEWEPSPTDVTFIEATFPDAAVTFNFPRPAQAGWEEALTAARATMLEAAARMAEDDAADSGRLGEERDQLQQPANGELLPVLWSEASPKAGLLEAVPHWPVASGRLRLALAVVAMTPRGTLGVYHLTHQQLGDHSFDELMAEACENLTTDLRVNGHQTDDGQLLSVSGTLVSAMVCLPDFYHRLSELLGAKRLVVGLPCPDEVYVAASDSPLANTIARAVHESEYPTTELVPCVLAIEGDHIEMISERDLTAR